MFTSLLFRKYSHSADAEYRMKEMQKFLKGLNFSFREGFSERATDKLLHQLKKNPEEIYYKNLSVLLPKIATISVAALLIMALILFVLHGSISPEKLIGADKIDENNFITYLILN